MSLNVFGKDGITVNGQSIEGTIRGSWFTAPASGNIVSISAYLRVTTASHNVKCAIYEYTAGGNAGNLIAQTDQISVGVAGEWTTFAFASPVAVTAATNYFLAIWANATSGDAVVVYDTGTSGRGISKAETYAASFPSPLTGESSTSNVFSIHANYENGPLHTRISQALVESLSQMNPPARISQAVVEVLSTTEEIVSSGAYRMFFAG